MFIKMLNLQLSICACTDKLLLEVWRICTNVRELTPDLESAAE